MSTQHLQTRPDPQPNRAATTRTPPAETATVRSAPQAAIDRAPKTFSHGNTARLENLIDEFNAAFATRVADSADGS